MAENAGFIPPTRPQAGKQIAFKGWLKCSGNTEWAGILDIQA